MHRYPTPSSSIIFSLSLILFNGTYCLSANAEDAPLAEVIVSGDPAETTAARLPGNVSIRSDDDLALPGDSNLEGLLNSIPNLTAAGGTSRPRFFQIRGIGELEQYEGAPNPSVGYLFDDLDLSGLGIAASLFDVERVEVLRGSQGIGHGASALAGLISVNGKDTTPYTTSHGLLSVGGDALREAGAAVSGPIDGTDKKLRMRVSLFDHHNDGFRRNEFLNRDDTNARDEFTGRTKLSWLPSNDLRFDLSAIRVDQDNGYDAFAIDNSYFTQSDKPGQDAATLNGTALKASYRVSSNNKIVSTTSYSHVNSTYSYDGDWGNDTFWGAYAPYDYFSETQRRRNTFGQELKWLSGKGDDDAKLLLGASFKRLGEDTAISEYAGQEIYDALQSDYRQSRSALFVERATPLGSETTLTTGVHLEHHDATYDDSGSARFSPSDNLVGGVIALSRTLTPTHHGFLSLSRGFKGGGFNPGTNTPSDLTDYSPEFLTTLESGVRSSWLENLLKTSLTAFVGYRRDQQARFAFQADPNDPLTFTYLTDNAARGRTMGLEGEARWALSTNFDLVASGALLDSEFTKYNTPLGASLEGRDTAHSPNWSYATSGEYTVTENLYFKVGVSGKDSFYFDDSHNERSHISTVTNAEVGWRDTTWSVTAWGRNLFNEDYALRGFFFGNEPPDFPNKLYIQKGEPAQFGVTATFYF